MPIVNSAARPASPGPSPTRFAAGRYPWTLQVGAGGIHRNYDDPDPTIDPNRRGRQDVLGPRGASYRSPTTWAMIPQVEIRDQQSNYEIS